MMDAGDNTEMVPQIVIANLIWRTQEVTENKVLMELQNQHSKRAPRDTRQGAELGKGVQTQKAFLVD